MSKSAKLTLCGVVGLLLLATLIPATVPLAPSAARSSLPARAVPPMPLHFEPNVGQFDPKILYLARSSGYTVALTRQGASLIPQGSPLNVAASVPSRVVNFIPMGASSSVKLLAENKFAGITNYFTSADSRNWHTRIPNYAQIVYKDVYPGIDLAYHGMGNLEYDFIVAPHADASAIKLRVEGAEGLTLDDGALTIRTASGTLRQPPPTIYQSGANGRQLLAGNYQLDASGEVSFKLPAYDHNVALVIDPVVVYSTYLGGSALDYVLAVSSDRNGNSFFLGLTGSNDLPIRNTLFSSSVVSANYGVVDFVTKLNPEGSDFVYSTYLPSAADFYSAGIAVDSAGNAYITGEGGGKDFPLVNAAQPKSGNPDEPGDVSDCFIMKLSADGSTIIYSTLLGASALDYGSAIAVDDEGHAYVTGFTASGGQPASDEDYRRNAPINFPTTNAVQPHHGGGYNDAFVAELSADGSAFIFSTYLGGSGNDAGTAIAVDSQHNIYVMGSTDSTNFPLRNPLYKQPRGSFLTKLAPAGRSILYSTYIGGQVGQTVDRFALDRADNLYVAGTLPAAGYPTPGPGDFSDYIGIPYVTQISADGTRVSATTQISDQGVVLAHDIQSDSAGNVYLITFNPPNDKVATATPPTDTVLMTRAPLTANTAVYTLHLDRRYKGYVIHFSLDINGNMYIGGETGNRDLPVKNAIQPSYGGGSSDGYALKLAGVVPSNSEAATPLMPATGADERSWLTMFIAMLAVIALGVGYRWRNRRPKQS